MTHNEQHPHVGKIEQARREQLEHCVPNVWQGSQALYIGANGTRFHFADRLAASGMMVDVLEIDKQACNELRTLDWLRNVIQGDVRDVESIIAQDYDLILWSHGPEIIEREHIDRVIAYLFMRTRQVMVTMSPWGKYHYTPQHFAHDKYPNIVALYGVDLQRLGFFTSVLGQRDINGSNLLAWRYAGS